MKYDMDTIEQKLREYPNLKNKLVLLTHELEAPAFISSDELLKVMAIGTSKYGNTHGNGLTNDRMMAMVDGYQEKANTMNNEVITQIVNELSRVRTELERMELYLSLLSEDQQFIIKSHCIEGHSWREIENETGYSRRTLGRRKNEGLIRLVEMYNYTSRFSSCY